MEAPATLDEDEQVMPTTGSTETATMQGSKEEKLQDRVCGGARRETQSRRELFCWFWRH